jgi:membrane protease YdiL (CAAX protease family)
MSNTVKLERPDPSVPVPEKAFPSILPAIGWVALFLLLQIIGGIAAVAIAVIMNGDPNLDPAAIMQDYDLIALPMIWSIIIAELFLLGLFWLYLGRKGRARAIQLDKWSNLSLVNTVLLAVALIGAGLAFNWAYSEYIVPDIEVQAELRKLFAAIPETLPNQILLFAAVAVIAPLVEELLFRGLLQKSLSHRLPIWAAIAISALIFGVMHMDLYAMPPLILMGAIFGVIYHLTGSLRVTILLHMVNNAAAVTIGG